MTFDRSRLLRGLAVAVVAIFLVGGAAFAGGAGHSRALQAGTTQTHGSQVQSGAALAAHDSQDVEDEAGDAVAAPDAAAECGQNEATEGTDEATEGTDEATEGTDEANEAPDTAEAQCGDEAKDGSDQKADDGNKADETAQGSDGQDGSKSDSGDGGSDSASDH